MTYDPSMTDEEVMLGVLDLAKKSLEETQSVMPMIHVFTEGKVALVGIPDIGTDAVSPGDARHAVIGAVGAMFKGQNVNKILFLSDVWMAIGKPGAPLPTGPVSKMPNRVEAILLQMIYADKGGVWMTCTYERHGEGPDQTFTFAEPDIKQDMIAEGITDAFFQAVLA